MARNVNQFGLVSATGPLRHFPQPVPMVSEQFQQLTMLLSEHEAEIRKIENDSTLSFTGKNARRAPVDQRFLERVDRMASNQQFTVRGIPEMEKRLTVPRPTTGSEVLDALRAMEVRSLMAGKSPHDQMEMLLLESPEVLHAVKDSPVPSPFQAEAEKALSRMAHAADPEASDALADYQEIAATLEQNWTAAKTAILNPAVKMAV